MIIDFETRSRCDLTTAGVDKYAAHPSTEILCAAFIIDGTIEIMWTPGEPPPADVVTALKNGSQLIAHGARFDQAIWEYIAVGDHGFPTIKPENWYCTMAQARVNALPASLNNATRALDSNHKKDPRGEHLIRQLCIPRKDGTFTDSPQLLGELKSYCMKDARATLDIYNGCRQLTPNERADWLANEKINDRGVKVDLPLALKATEYADVEKAQIKDELIRYTKGELYSPSQHQKFPIWVLGQAAHLKPFMVKYDQGQEKLSLDKEHLTNIINRADDGALSLPNHVYNALQCKLEASGSAVAKFKRMAEMASEQDHRVRGAFVYAGAATLRYTSRGLQFHNFKRDCHSNDDAELYRRAMLNGVKFTPGATMEILGKLLRPALIPEDGNVFVVGDWSSIESRALPWLANTFGGKQKLDTFKRHDADPTLPDNYQIAAKDAGVEDRQVGKVIELALGFGGSVGAFNAMGKNYGVHLPEHRVTEIVENWRRNNQWASYFWRELTAAAKRAIEYPHRWVQAGRVSYTFAPNLMHGSLQCLLPGGTIITYPQARIEAGDITSLKANWTPKAGETEWPRYTLWHGVLAENVTQAFCAALLRWLIREVDYIILHCHDEVCLEVKKDKAQYWAKILQQKMEAGPDWAKELPLKAKPKILTRYGK